jgi:hypothetical protein
MTTTYTRSLTTDFSGLLNQYQFHTEIKNEAGITPTLVGVNLNGDGIDIIFESALSAGEEITLNTLISNHTPNIDYGNKMIVYSLHSTNIIANSFKKILNFAYPGNKAFSITHIEVTSCLVTGTSYEVRVRDLDNNNNIASINLTNTTLNSLDMGTVSNLPMGRSQFEIQAKVSGDTNSKACLESIIIYYN